MSYKIAVGLAILSIIYVLSCVGNDSEQGDQTFVESEHNRGKEIFKKYCILCHGSDGKLGLNGALDLTISELTLEERIVRITNGKNTMIPYKDVLDQEEIESVAKYTMKFNSNQ